MANVFEPEWQIESDRPPFLFRMASIGAQAGADRLGASLYEIAPGGQVSPLHVHHANEELIIVLSGRPTLRTADGSRELVAGVAVACPVGRRGAHVVMNKTDEPVLVLIVSTMVFPDVVEHLDSDTVLVLTAPPDHMGEDDIALAFSRDHAVDPTAGEPPA
jgi:uncharacterized cupin superfamily protein